MNIVFSLLFFGCFFTSVIVSVWSKGVCTIQLIYIPIGFILLWEAKKAGFFSLDFFRKDVANTKLLLGFVVGIIIIWLLQGYFVLDWRYLDSYYPYQSPQVDAAFYGRLSEKLIHSSFESTLSFHNYQNESLRETTPYHYFELWLTAFFSNLFSVSGYLAYSLIVLPLFQITVWAGVLFYAKNLRDVVPLYLLFGLLFFTGIYVPFYSNIQITIGTYWLTNSLFTGMSEHYLWWITASLFLQKRNRRASLYVIMLVPFANPTLWATCWGAILFLLIWNRSKLNWKRHWLILLLFFALPLYYASFYSITGSPTNIVSKSSFLSLDNLIAMLQSVKGLCAYLLSILIIYLPFFFWVYKGRWYITLPDYILRNWLVFFVGAMIGGSLLYLILHNYLENFQLIRNFALPFIQVSLVLFIIQAYPLIRTKRVHLFVVFAFVIYGIGFTVHWYRKEIVISSAHSRNYLEKLMTIESLQKGVTWHGKSAYDITPIFNYNGNFRQPATYLAFKKGLTLYNLDMVCLSEEEQNNHLKTDFFANWLKQYPKNIQCQDSLKWKFAEEKRIDFAVLGQNVPISENIRPVISFYLKDSLSGEQFLRLDWAKQIKKEP